MGYGLLFIHQDETNFARVGQGLGSRVGWILGGVLRIGILLRSPLPIDGLSVIYH
jgi:hypothetical protein